MKRLLPTLAALILVIAGGVWYFTSRPTAEPPVPAAQEQAASETGEDTAQTEAEPEAEETTGAEVALMPDMVLGDPNAPVTVIEYASYTCPHCANFHKDQFKKLKADYIDTGKVKFIHREVYFDRYGLWGGLLANCGGEMRYYGLSGMLYDQQEEWIGAGGEQEILDNLTRLGKTAGLSEEQINACLNDEGMATRLVATFQANAEADGINATPTLVIDGEKHSNMSYDDLASIIDARLGED